MRNETVIVTLCITLFCAGGVCASGGETNDVSKLEAQYIVQTNGMLAVCAFDPGRALLLRLKGIEIERGQLPQWGHRSVYELGERPSVNSDPWHVPKEFHHFYGKIPYQVEDIDPALSSHWDKKGNLLVGVRLRGRFYAFRNLGQVPKNDTATKEIGIQPPLNIVDVKPPQHRADDIDVFAKKEQTRYSSAE